MAVLGDHGWTGGGGGGRNQFLRQTKSEDSIIIARFKLQIMRPEKWKILYACVPLCSKKKNKYVYKDVVLYIQARSNLSNNSILVERRAAEKACTLFFKHGQKN